VKSTCSSARSVPAALFQSIENRVVQYQMRAILQLAGDGTFFFQTVQQTDSELLGKGPEQTLFGGGTYTYTDSQIIFYVRPTQVAPANMTINTDGTLTRFYNITIEPPFAPQVIEVTETYRLIP
jgi:hypothetical protein